MAAQQIAEFRLFSSYRFWCDDVMSPETWAALQLLYYDHVVTLEEVAMKYYGIKPKNKFAVL